MNASKWTPRLIPLSTQRNWHPHLDSLRCTNLCKDADDIPMSYKMRDLVFPFHYIIFYSILSYYIFQYTTLFYAARFCTVAEYYTIVYHIIIYNTRLDFLHYTTPDSHPLPLLNRVNKDNRRHTHVNLYPLHPLRRTVCRGCSGCRGSTGCRK